MSPAREFSVPLDLGASWIHGISGNPLYPYAEKLNLKLNVTKNPDLTAKGGFQLFGPGGAIPDEAHEDTVRSKFEILLLKAKEAMGQYLNPEDISVAELFSIAEKKMENPFTDREKHLFNWMKSGIEGWENTSLETLSARGFFSEHEETLHFDGDAFVTDGYFRIPQHLAENLGHRVKLNHEVLSVQYNDNNVTLATNRGNFTADYVICTIPIGCLKARDVKFDPPLPPAKLTAIDRIGFGLMNKIILEFDEPFWNEESEGIGYLSESILGEFNFIMNLLPILGKPILVCYTAADFAHKLESLSDEETRSRIMTLLRSLYPQKTIPEPRVFRVTRWGLDRYTRGSYSFFKTGCTDQHVRTMAAPLGRLHFAGEHTDARPGYVTGAFASGIREAKAVLQEIANAEKAVPMSKL
eukprot:TRINITY_DN3217_c0_g1_i1.p1 TRINITY_DN3217_c0_g1~~TRINITY_DN3217_c0_g1_i1.p1  ORF type:complete len:460 (-),score=97.52 TRINITY_DN3217_c0_g1_i1:68-1303(-)